MPILPQEELHTAIVEYKKKHQRFIDANFEGTIKRYPVEQQGRDIIETMEARILELERKLKSIKS
jgi:hypothetical protein